MAFGLEAPQPLAEARVLEERSLAVEVRHDQERRPNPMRMRHLERELDLVLPGGRDVVDRDVDGHDE